MAEFARLLATEAVAKEIEIAKEYYGALRGYRRHARARRIMENLAKHAKSYYGRQAARALATADPLPPKPKWETLLAPSSERPQEWRYHQWDGAMPASIAGWQGADFDDSAWQRGAGPFQRSRGKATAWRSQRIVLRKAFDLSRTDYEQLSLTMDCPAGTQVYLNGYRVVEIVSTPRRPYEPVALHDKAVELLKKGANLIAVQSQKGRSAILDVGLRAARPKRK